MAGVPFEVLEELATPEIARSARELLSRQAESTSAKTKVKQVISARREEFSKEQLRLLRKALYSGIQPEGTDAVFDITLPSSQAAALVAAAEAHFGLLLEPAIHRVRVALYESAALYLPSYLVFAAEGVRERVIQQLADSPTATPHRNKRARAEERHLVLYLQRVAGKNDSLSQFGPEGWGRIDPDLRSLQFSPQPGIARREVFLERWTAHGAVAAINADPETKEEIAPRLHPHGRLAEGRFINTETGETVFIDSDLHALLTRCNGKTPAHSLGAPLNQLADLAHRHLIVWEMEVCALDPHAFDLLVAEIGDWREGPVRDRWLKTLQPLAELPAEFARRSDPLSRLGVIEEATQRLDQIGAHKKATRFLYAATNPIGEECFRETNFAIGEELIDEVAHEAAPWIDLWCDNYAFVASRVAEGLRHLLEEAPLRDGSIPLPAFLRHCAQRQMPLTGPGVIAFAHNAFREVKAAFAEQLSPHANDEQYELTAIECQIVRARFEFERFPEYTYPSADLQLGAASIEAAGRGEYQWVLAELHPSVALLHHGFYWSCPDREALSRALRRAVCGQPNFHFGYFAVDFTAATSVRLFDGLPGLTYFAAPQRAHEEWPTIPPSECEVFIQESNGDVGLRRWKTGEYLGSFARAWTIPLGFHPFSFSLGRNTPRLSCGRVVVQRRTWAVTLEELGAGDFTGISRDLVLAVERLRGARGLPRHIYIRPTENALRRSGVEGRDKDTKPVYIDLESYLFLEIFHRWLTKAGEIEITEMLPTPEQLLWQEPDGRRTFELRTQIIPR